MANELDPEKLKQAWKGALEIDYPGYEFKITLDSEREKEEAEKRKAASDKL